MKALSQLTAHDVGFDVEAHLFGMWAAELDAPDYGENRGRLWAELESHLGEAYINLVLLAQGDRSRAVSLDNVTGHLELAAAAIAELQARIDTYGAAWLAAFRTSKHSEHVAA